MKKLYRTFLPLFIVLHGMAQMPVTNIWLFHITKDKSGKVQLEKPTLINKNKGYNNQPSFSEDGKSIYYTSAAGNQTDIFSYNIRSQKTGTITRTPESEFSPVSYTGDKILTTVAVETDSSQRIHFIDTESGKSTGKLQNDSIGYYCFLNSDTVVVYKLTQPHSLRWINKQDEEEHFIVHSPIRTFKAIGRQRIVFGVKDSTATQYYTFDLATKKIVPYATHSPGSQDIFWNHQHGLLIALEDALWQYRVEDNSWSLLFKTGDFGIHKISRFAISKNGKYLVIVDNPK